MHVRGVLNVFIAHALHHNQWYIFCMHYIVALGNPGTQYVGTRHNFGFAVADALVMASDLPAPRASSRYHGQLTEGVIDGETVTLLWPLTYMNNSGEAAAALVPKDKVSRLIAVYDEAALPLGKIRISIGGTAGGHNGVRSLIEHLGTPEFIRVRLGVGGAPAEMPLERYVLSRFAPEEAPMVEKLTADAVAAIRYIIRDGVDTAMNTVNG
jgi:peptidyl-tRNA hydrolase, PTH1 family